MHREPGEILRFPLGKDTPAVEGQIGECQFGRGDADARYEDELVGNQIILYEGFEHFGQRCRR